MSRTITQSPDVKSQEPIGVTQLKNPTSSEGSHSKRTVKIQQIWWSNSILFISFHVVGLSAWYIWPSSWRTWFLCYINWQIGTLGITIG
jgi:fatty-acid desaturase